MGLFDLAQIANRVSSNLGVNPYNVAKTQGSKLYNAVSDPNIDLIPGIGLPDNGTPTNSTSYSTATNLANRQQGDYQRAVNGGAQVLGASTSGGGVAGGYAGTGGAASGTSQEELFALAQLDGQEGMLRQLLNDSGTQLNQGLSQLTNDYNKNYGDYADQQARTNRNFATKKSDTTAAKESQLTSVGDHARSLRNSILQRIGAASGSGSSAYQLAAPGAVNRDTQIQRQDVTDTYGKNFRDISTAEDDASNQYSRLFRDLQDQRQQKEQGLRTGIEQQRQQVNQQLGDIGAQRSVLRGGGVSAANAARAPYSAAADQSRSAINDIFNRFTTPYSVQAPNIQQPSLRDYTTDRAQVNAAAQTGTDPTSTSPYAPFLKPVQEDDPAKLLYA